MLIAIGFKLVIWSERARDRLGLIYSESKLYHVVSLECIWRNIAQEYNQQSHRMSLVKMEVFSSHHHRTLLNSNNFASDQRPRDIFPKSKSRASQLLQRRKTTEHERTVASNIYRFLAPSSPRQDLQNKDHQIQLNCSGRLRSHQSVRPQSARQFLTRCCLVHHA
jgi:hypothetical protein